MGGEAGREAAALITGDRRATVRFLGARHLAILGDPRAFDALARLAREGAKERDGGRQAGLDVMCATYLIRRGFADQVEGAKLLMDSLSYLDFRGTIHTLANRGSLGTEKYLVDLCSSRRAYHGVKLWAIRAMAAADRKSHLPVLRGLLSDPWALVRNEAAQELVRRRDLAALPLMRRAATMPDQANRVNGTPGRDANGPMRRCLQELEQPLTPGQR